MKLVTLAANNQRKPIGFAKNRRAVVFVGVAAAATLGGGKIQVQYLSADGTTWEPLTGVGAALTGLLAGECMSYDVVDMQLAVQLIGATGTVSVPVNIGIGTN
jgi:hypothetical protein